MATADLPPGQLAWLLIPVALVIMALRGAGSDLARRLPLALARAFVQLSLVGYVLVFVFEADRPLLTVTALGLLCAFAALFSLVLLAKERRPGLFPLALVAILPPVAGLALFASGVVVPGVGILDPRHAVGVGGMLAGNAMNAVSLAADRFFSGIRDRRGEVEGALMAGASGAEALAPLRAEALRAAVTPSLNGLLAVGLVSLPGMMTGQILAGGAPLVAARYQMMIMVLWLAAASLAPALFLRLLERGLLAGGRLPDDGRGPPPPVFRAAPPAPPARRPVVFDERPHRRDEG